MLLCPGAEVGHGGCGIPLFLPLWRVGIEEGTGSYQLPHLKEMCQKLGYVVSSLSRIVVRIASFPAHSCNFT